MSRQQGLTSLSFGVSSEKAFDAASMLALTQLRELRVFGRRRRMTAATGMCDADLKTISRMSCLTALSLRGFHRVTDCGLTSLRSLPRLRRLELWPYPPVPLDSHALHNLQVNASPFSSHLGHSLYPRSRQSSLAPAIKGSLNAVSRDVSWHPKITHMMEKRRTADETASSRTPSTPRSQPTLKPSSGAGLQLSGRDPAGHLVRR